MVILAPVPEQIDVVPPGVIFVGKPLTVISTVKVVGEAGHPLATGVTVYLLTPVLVVVNVCAIVVPHDDAQFDAPDTLPDSKASVHVKVVPLTVEFKATLLALPLHIACGLAEPTGVGFTVIVAVILLPTQKVGPGPVGVIVKVTVTGDVVVLVNAAPVMLPEPLVAMPVTAPVVLSFVHANVVPPTPLLVLNARVVNELPEQMV
jgi:hypothetical protein